MFKIKEKINFLKYDTHNQLLKRFIIVLCVFTIYFIFVILKYGLKDGIFVGLLTWCFFVFCTPVADAGLLVGFPVRLLTGIRFLYTQILVYFVAILIVFVSLFFYPSVFDYNLILKVFKKILLNPIPYWIILIICFFGTILSTLFGDELLDVLSHSDRKFWHEHHFKHNLILILFLFLMCIVIYLTLISELGIDVLTKQGLNLI